MAFEPRVYGGVQETCVASDVRSWLSDDFSGTSSSSGLSNAETISQASYDAHGFDALLEAARILEKRGKEPYNPPVWPEGQRDTHTIAHDSSGKPYVPESDPYRGINWLLQAAASLGDLPRAPVIQASPAKKPKSSKRKRSADEGHQCNIQIASSKSARRKPSRSTENLTRAGPAWGKVPISHPAAESGPKGQKPDGPAMRRDSRVSDYQPSEAAESICSTASESMFANSKSERPKSKTKLASKARRSAKMTLPDSPNSSSPRSKKQIRASTISDGRVWTNDDKATLKSLRDPYRPDGPVKHQDIANLLGDRTSLACRLQCDKMRKAGEWPWRKDDERKGKERKRAAEEAAKVDGRRSITEGETRRAAHRVQ